MANQLTHALSAAAAMALINPFIGLEPISWNIFLAAIIGILMNLDCSDCKISRGSPLGHSLGMGMGLVYLVVIIVYLGHAFFGFELLNGMIIALAMGVGIFAHLFAEFFTGQQIFTIPKNLDFMAWFSKYDRKSEKFWSSWDRACLEKYSMNDYHLNGISLALILVAIGLF